MAMAAESSVMVRGALKRRRLWDVGESGMKSRSSFEEMSLSVVDTNSRDLQG